MALTEKFKSIVGFLTQGLEQRDDVFEDMADELGIEYQTRDNLALAPMYEETYAPKNDKNNDLKVVSHPNFRGYEVIVVEPRSFSEAGNIVQNLKDKKTVVLNLHLLDKEQSQRTIDFVCGAAHALCGKPQKVGDMVFIFTPNNVTLSVPNTENQSKFNDSLWNRPL